MSDPVDAAIAAAAAPKPIELREYAVTIASTGRPAALLIPSDCTVAELAELAGWMLNAVRIDLAQRAANPSGIILPGPVRPT